MRQRLPLFEVAAREGYPSHNRLARRLGYAQTTISRLAAGAFSPSLRLRRAVQEAFPQYDPDYLLGLTPAAPARDGVPA